MGMIMQVTTDKIFIKKKGKKKGAPENIILE